MKLDSVQSNPTPQFKVEKIKPFGAHFTSKLEAVNNKLVCALSAATTCVDDGDISYK